MNSAIAVYNQNQNEYVELCSMLAHEIDSTLKNANSKVWHAHPVWFLDDNPIVGYAVRKNGVQLLFWSGQSFDEKELANEGSFKAAQKNYQNVDEVHLDDLRRWLTKAQNIQWDYKNIVKNKGALERIK